MMKQRSRSVKPFAAWILGIAVAGCALAAFKPASADVAAPEPLTAFPQSLLAIRTAGGKVINFKIWTADRPSRQEQGLMFVHSMDKHAGMLFVFPAAERISMWMKNTYLSLDMVFIDAAGRIDYIAPRAAPQSLDIIRAPRPISAVLELNGGTCEDLGIAPGDLVLNQNLQKTR